MKKKPSEIDRDYVRRARVSTPEQRLDWLAAAADFATTPKKRVKKNRSSSSR